MFHTEIFSLLAISGFLCVVSNYSHKYSFYGPSNSNTCYFHLLNVVITLDLISGYFLYFLLCISNSTSPVIKSVLPTSQYSQILGKWMHEIKLNKVLQLVDGIKQEKSGSSWEKGLLWGAPPSLFMPCENGIAEFYG